MTACDTKRRFLRNDFSPHFAPCNQDTVLLGCLNSCCFQYDTDDDGRYAMQSNTQSENVSIRFFYVTLVAPKTNLRKTKRNTICLKPSRSIFGMLFQIFFIRISSVARARLRGISCLARVGILPKSGTYLEESYYLLIACLNLTYRWFTYAYHVSISVDYNNIVVYNHELSSLS